MLGNFPQALTHMALVNTARLLSMPAHEAQVGERAGRASDHAAAQGATGAAGAGAAARDGRPCDDAEQSEGADRDPSRDGKSN